MLPGLFPLSQSFVPGRNGMPRRSTLVWRAWATQQLFLPNRSPAGGILYHVEVCECRMCKHGRRAVRTGDIHAVLRDDG
jgi:hypothetical protein